MGGDHGCGVVIEGAKRALEAGLNISALHLVGQETEIHAALARTFFPQVSDPSGAEVGGLRVRLDGLRGAIERLLNWCGT